MAVITIKSGKSTTYVTPQAQPEPENADEVGVFPTEKEPEVSILDGVEPVVARVRVSKSVESSTRGKRDINNTKMSDIDPPNTQKPFTDDELSQILDDEELPKRERQSKSRRETADAVEYRRKQIHRLLLRGVPKKTICEYLNIPVSSFYKDLNAINCKLREEIMTMDYPLFIAQSVSFFDEARNIALRLATDTKERSNMVKMRALDVAIKAEAEKHKYLGTIGLYKSPSPIDTGQGAKTNDADDFMSLLANAAAGAIPDSRESFAASRINNRVVTDAEYSEVDDE